MSGAAVGALLKREVVRFLRQRNRIVGALGTPLVFWFLIGSGVGRTFRLPAGGFLGSGPALDYLQYFFPGALLLTVLFTAIFSTISIIEDRQAGFLQGVLVSPVSRADIVLGKLLGGTLLAFGQALLFLLLLPFLKPEMTAGGFFFACLVLLLLSFSLTGLGFALAWRLDSTQGFHAVMNLFLMPLWFLSGALFPAAGAPVWLRLVMKANPLAYGTAALQRSFFRIDGALSGLPSPGVSAAVLAAFALAMWILAVKTASRTDAP